MSLRNYKMSVQLNNKRILLLMNICEKFKSQVLIVNTNFSIV